MEKTNPAGPILIVDDEQSLLRLIERTLRREEFQTVALGSGAEAISWLGEHRADLMLLDLNLLDMSGQDVIHALAKKNQSVPFIVITGHDDVRVAVEIMKMGAIDYLVKGPDFLEMLPVVVHRVMAQLETKRKLVAAEERVRLVQSVVEQGFNAVLITSAEIPHPRIVYVNPAFSTMTGYPMEAILGESVEVLQEFSGAFARLGQHPASEPGFLDGRVAHSKGEKEQWIEWRIGPVHDPAGKIAHWVAIMRDITPRMRAEAALQESEERYRNLVELSPEVIFLCCEERIVFMNQAGLRFFGAVAAEEVLGKSPLDFVHADYHENQRRIQGSAAAGESSPRQEHKWVRLDGTIVDAEVTATCSKHRGKPAIQVVARDISERKRLEKQILDISELEQRRIAEDLHDGLCQNLAGVQLMSQVLEQKLAGRSSDVAGAAAEIAKLVRQSIAHTRDLVKGLSPVLHHEEGLVPALQELAAHTETAFHVPCVFKNGSTVQIPDQTVATHLYRIAQEAVNNSIKHGKAKRIVIDLSSVKDRTILSLRDDGIGFPRKVRNQKGVGLQIMEYRASMIGGTLTIQPESNGGTAVICSIQKSESGSSSGRKLDYEKEISNAEE